MYDAGTAQEYIVCSEEDVEVAPKHLSAIEGAALPLVGLTGWRALVTKTGENASRGRNILITGFVFSIPFPLTLSACLESASSRAMSPSAQKTASLLMCQRIEAKVFRVCPAHAVPQVAPEI